ncbi:peptide chain release factor N(5)-glutamine methyltransferase [Filobacillus milosensis]|uniref:Release factor glutamine methyltransferase n=1 Tax=Filobacillus milosensis TaxID=94137 RepID=A0A4Y8IFP4_9BACI|nr:peptide chain release factor N(5)-glutamine methyltransferase [Filobacillus milosensis]TFB19297.1 peptide chain release factor N(5)-glutamine methyltransferase [Filobacillus milosensis]
MSKTVKEARVWASSFLKKHNREPRVADLMLQHLLDVGLADFLLIQREKLSDEVWTQFEGWIVEHAESGKPLEHFTGVASFYGLEFLVDKNVLIPRPETEELIEAVRPWVRDGDTVVDVGTGSGIIAVTLKKVLPSTRVLATDISRAALEAASRNAQRHETEVEFLEGSFLKPVLGQVSPDIIVSNPPYIPERERVALSETVMHDPESALFADENGLAAYRAIVNQVMQFAKLPRLVAFEIGHDQGESVPNIILEVCPKANIEVIKDINGKNRILLWKN